MSDDIEYLPPRKSRKEKGRDEHSGDERVDRRKLTYILGAVALILAALLLALAFLPKDSRLNTIFHRGSDETTPTASANGTGEVQYDADGNPIPGTGGGTDTTGGGAGGGGTGGGNGPAPGATILPADMIPHDWINEFYADMMAGRYEAAQQKLPASIRANLSAEQLQTRNAADPIVSVSSESDPAQADATTAEVTSTLTLQSGATSVQKWQFEKQGTSWVLVGRIIEGMPG